MSFVLLANLWAWMGYKDEAIPLFSFPHRRENTEEEALKGGGVRGRGGDLLRDQDRPEADRPGHDCGPTPPHPPPRLLALLRRHAGRCRHPCLYSGTVLCCYGNSGGSLVGGGRQPLCGNQHWRQQLCPFPEAV